MGSETPALRKHAKSDESAYVGATGAAPGLFFTYQCFCHTRTPPSNVAWSGGSGEFTASYALPTNLSKICTYTAILRLREESALCAYVGAAGAAPGLFFTYQCFCHTRTPPSNVAWSGGSGAFTASY